MTSKLRASGTEKLTNSQRKHLSVCSITRASVKQFFTDIKLAFHGTFVVRRRTGAFSAIKQAYPNGLSKRGDRSCGR